MEAAVIDIKSESIFNFNTFKIIFQIIFVVELATLTDFIMHVEKNVLVATLPSVSF